MERNNSQYKKHVLHVMNNQCMAHLFKIYAELIRRADVTDHCFTCSIDELAKCLGYNRDDLDAILIDLIMFNIIDIRIGYKDNSKRMITLRIY